MNFDNDNNICTAKDVIRILNVSQRTAERKISLLRDALNKPKPKIITIGEFKNYYGIGRN